MRRIGLPFVFLCATAVAAPELAPTPRKGIDLTGYRTTADAIPADPKLVKATTAAPAVPGFVGVEIGTDEEGRPAVADVAPGSPAEAAGLRAGDVIARVGDAVVATVPHARDRLRGLAAGTPAEVVVIRSGSEVSLSVTPRPASSPLKLTETGGFGGRPARAVLGIQMEPAKDGGAAITSVTPGGAADKAKLKAGDVVVRADETKVEADGDLREVLSGKRPGDVVKLLVKRGDDELDVRVTLQGESTGRGGVGWDDRLPRYWTKPTYKLAVIGVEFPDVKHSDKIADADWEASLFSTGTYAGKNATGQPVHGSMNDYFREISYGKFSVAGKFVGWVEVSKKRTEYGQGTSKGPLLSEAMDKAAEQFGKDLDGYDGLFILYAGGMATSNRGNIYWPHRATLTHRGKRWPYFIVNELRGGGATERGGGGPGRGGLAMQDISVFCHEFGHMLGLPDLYARPENPGSEGVGVWCAMSNQAGGGRPQHFSAWCRERLGWATPVTIDPRVKQKLILSPIEDNPTECYKVLARPDGSEYFLLENRRKTGFDASLPAEGLLIWRVVGGKLILEESHGVDGPAGPRVYPADVPFPSRANDSFTPYTTPSSKSQLGGGFDVYITNVRRLPDGRITFHIGYEYQ